MEDSLFSEQGEAIAVYTWQSYPKCNRAIGICLQWQNQVKKLSLGIAKADFQQRTIYMTWSQPVKTRLKDVLYLNLRWRFQYLLIAGFSLGYCHVSF